MRSTAQFDLVLRVPQVQQEAQQKRQQKECEQLGRNIASIERQLTDEEFLAKAPSKVVDSLRQKLGDYQLQFQKNCNA